jgi:hypothetical protein
MRKLLWPLAVLLAISITQTGCGLHVPVVPELWDLVGDTEATKHMEVQVKQAIFCELRDAIHIARERYKYERSSGGKVISTKEDQPIPDSWGVQQTLTFTIDELSKVNPGATLIWPYKKPLTSDSFSLGLGGQLSSDATRTDKYSTFYTVADLATTYSERDVCHSPPEAVLGPPSHSSPFTVLSDLGIREWLPQATAVSAYLRSSRQNPNGEGPPLGSAGSFASDSFSYDVKFVILSDANVTPQWKLVRVSTPSSPALFDTSRTRTHELLLTIGPGATVTVKKGKNQFVVMTVAPTQSASSSHLAQEIGNAVATAIRPQLSVTGITVP